MSQPELIIRTPEGAAQNVRLTQTPLSLGRSAANDLSFTDDSGLSRRHMAFEPLGSGWQVRDLGSKNGTFVNAERLADARPLRNGDRITAGRLTIEFRDTPARPRAESVSFVDQAEASVPLAGAVMTRLDLVLKPAAGPREREGAALFRSPPFQALIRAGRELAGHRPLDELFPLILELSMEAVGASRGVLMTLENGELSIRAARGAELRISRAVRDRILNDKASVLVRDAQFDEAFRSRESIVAHRVRSMMAVPLQTSSRVIGLIYVDMPNIIQPFTEEELALLTVMANIAAIRIEQARLAEVEQAERLMARELSQAAEIQNGLLPDSAPEIPGYDLAGHTIACRTVGGDYYDFLEYPGGCTGLLVGDVAGKGLSAALLMTSLQARVQVLAESGPDPKDAVTRLNRSLAGNCPGNRFVTFFYSVLDPATGELRYTNAGHNPPMVVRKGGAVERLETGGIVLGILDKQCYGESSTRLGPGDLLVLYSDGVTEACRTGEDEEFGEDRLAEFLAARPGHSSSDLISEILECLGEWTAGAPQADDMTLTILRRL